MSDPGSEQVIASNRDAVQAFLETARSVPPGRWTTPRASGKWSPAQITEHVALTYEQSDRMLHGTFTGPAMPWYKQLLARKLGLPPLLRRGDFGEAPLKGPDFIRPTASPPSLDVLADRMESAGRNLEQSLAAAPSDRRVKVDHPIFGRLPLEDLLHFLFIHTNHHRPQISMGALL